MPTDIQTARNRMAAVAAAAKVPVSVSVSIPLTDAKGSERHQTKAAPAAFAKASGTGTGLIASVLAKTSVVKTSLTVADENGDKSTSSPDALLASVWKDTYAKA